MSFRSGRLFEGVLGCMLSSLMGHGHVYCSSRRDVVSSVVVPMPRPGNAVRLMVQEAVGKAIKKSATFIGF